MQKVIIAERRAMPCPAENGQGRDQGRGSALKRSFLDVEAAQRQTTFS